MSHNEYDTQIINDMMKFANKKDYLGLVMYSFPWGEDELTNYQLEDWQKNILIDMGKNSINVSELINKIQRYAVGSGHGIGKTALICIIILILFSTFEDTRGVVTANTDTQLRTKTWSEMAKWHRLFIASHFFTYTATALYSKDPNHEKTWRMDCIPWSKSNPAAFAGLHNKGKRLIIVFDESSEIDDVIWEVTEGALTDSDTEIFWFAFGNRTRNIGKFSDCFKKHKILWNTRCIDSRTVRITNKELINIWLEQHGIDSDFFKVRVLGEEPSTNSNQFYNTNLIRNARGKQLRQDQYIFAPVILTCDPAWTGSDSIVIGKRQGLFFTILDSIPKNDNDIVIANKLMAYEDEYKASAVFIDLGYGTGIFSVGKTLGRNWILISNASASNEISCINKRAETALLLKRWLEEGGVLPDDQELCEELSWIETVANLKGKIQLISKEDIKKMYGRSPNKFDALCLSFAYPVANTGNNIILQSNLGNQKYDLLGMNYNYDLVRIT